MSEQRKTWTSEVIRSERDTILRVWEEQVRVQVPGLDALPQPFLRDHLPRMLDALASWLDSDQHEPAFPSLSRAHGAQRLGHGVRLRDLMREYRVLREVIQRTFLARAAREPALAQAARDEEMVRFHRGLDFGATLSAESYASLREDALEALQERLRLALHSGGVGTWDYAPATRSFVIDPQGQALLGLPEDEPLPYEEFLRRLMPGDREAVGRLLEEALSGQVRGTLQVDFQLAQPPGESPVWIHSEGRVLFEPDGEVIGLIGTLVDVSEHTMRLAAEQHAHRQTEQARARLDELLRQAPLAVCILRGREMRFDLANDAYQRLVGRTDLVGRTVAEALPEVMTQGYPELLERVFTTGERVVSNEARLDLDRHHTGELETCFLTSTHEPFRDERREVAGILVTAIDVTELVRARRVAEEASVARGP